MSRQREYGEDLRGGEDRDREEEEEEERSQTLSEEEEELKGTGSAQQRKRDALFPAISSICQALGGYEEFKNVNGEIITEYSLGDQVVACLKDLKRFWRMDERDSDRTVARIFYEVGVLKNDLVPILLSTLGTNSKGDRIALACVELMGAMTWPIDVAEELRDAKILDELKKSSDYTSLITAQMSYKATILRTGTLAAMFQLMSPCLTKSRRERSKKDENIISLILHTFRNLAALKDRVTASHSADAIEQSTLQSELIKQMSSEYIFELLISIAHNADLSEFADYNMVTLDILHLIFRGVKPSDLMIPDGKIDKINDERLSDLLNLEGKEKLATARKTTSRHSRFGTTVALKSNGHQYILHKQSTLTVGAESTLDAIKKGKAKKIREDDDLSPPSNLTPDAIRCLRDVAISFIDSAFNPFFSSILKDIRMERLKVKESDTIRFLFLSRFFLEFFLLLYEDEKRRGIDPEKDENGHGFDLIAEMTEPQCIGFVTQRMKIGLDEKPPLWVELHAGVDCFIQILLVIDALAASGVEENVDIAEILQNKLYYEAETLDMVVNVIVRYTNQSMKYLDSVIHLSYVLLRMLEKYSKSKAYMYVRKKKSRGKKRAKKIDENAEDGMGMGEDEEEEEIERGTLNYGEHAFEFSKFEQKFAEESVLQTCMVYLEGYKSFSDPEQMKRIVSLMHRQAVKTNSEALFFKPSVLQIFQRILADESLFHVKGGAPAADLKKLIEYVLKKFFKAVKDSPFVCLEIFFPKTRNQLGKLRDGIEDPYASSDEDTFFKAGNGEVEVQPGFSLSQQIGIAVACLVDDHKLSLVELVQSQLHLASLARKEIVLTTDGQLNVEIEDQEMSGEVEDNESEESIRKKAAKFAGPSKEAIDLFRTHTIPFDSDDEKKAAAGNGHFKLLMRLLKWASAALPESSELVWAIPAELIPSILDGDIKLIENFLLDPVDPNGKSAADLLRKKRKVPSRKRKMLPSDVENSDGEIVPAPKKAKKRKEEMEAYKSAQFIEDSDDEENADADAIFFAAEAALRVSLAAGAISAAAVAGQGKKKKDTTSTSSSKKSKSNSKSKSKAQVKLKEAPKKVRRTAGMDEISDISDGDDFEILRKAAREAREGSSGGVSLNGKISSSDSPTSEPEEALEVEKGSEVESEEEEEKEVALRKKRVVIIDSDDE